jgi:hypothetical protein
MSKILLLEKVISNAKKSRQNKWITLSEIFDIIDAR